jgi:hypothetical protein
LQATCVVEEGTIFSKVVPQSRHLNSNSGIASSPCEYSQSPAGLQSSLPRVWRAPATGTPASGHFFWLFRGPRRENVLTERP